MSSDGRMLKWQLRRMPIVDAMLAPTSHCWCDVDIKRPIALSIYPHNRLLLRYYGEKTPASPLPAAVGSSQERRKRSRPVCPPVGRPRTDRCWLTAICRRQRHRRRRVPQWGGALDCPLPRRRRSHRLSVVISLQCPDFFNQFFTLPLSGALCHLSVRLLPEAIESHAAWMNEYANLHSAS